MREYKNDNRRLSDSKTLRGVFRKHLIHKHLSEPKSSMVSLRMSLCQD
jgi:hypothetical protein